jgi:hypothetical protein
MDYKPPASPETDPTVNGAIAAHNTSGASHAALVTLAPATSARNVIQPGAANAAALVLKGAAAQTANPLEVQTSAGVVLARIGANGTLTIADGTYPGFTLSNAATFPVLSLSQGWGESLRSDYNGTIAMVGASQPASHVPLRARGGPAQTGNLFEAQSSASVVLARVTSGGVITTPAGFNVDNVQYAGYNTMGGSFYGGSFTDLVLAPARYLEWGGNSANGSYVYDADVTTSVLTHMFRPTRAAAVPVVVQGRAAQSADLFQCQTSALTVVAKVWPSGHIDSAKSLAFGSSGDPLHGPINAAGGEIYHDTGNAQLLLAMNHPTVRRAFSIVSYLASGAPLVPFTISGNGTTTLTPNVAGSSALIVKGAIGQTANLQDWQDSAGTAQSSLTVAGQLVIKRISQTGGSGSAFEVGQSTSTVCINGLDATVLTGAQLTVRARNTSDHTQINRGVPGQTGDLHQWQDSTPVVVARITVAGAFRTVAGLGAWGVVPPAAQPALPAAAVDPATTMALVNALRTAVIAYGLTT